MSEEDEKEKMNRAIAFYEAISGYFRERPLEAISFLHDIVEGLADMIKEKEDLRKDLGYFVGQLYILTYVIWTFDHLGIVEKLMSYPSTRNDIMEAVMKSAKAYYLLHSGEPIAISNIAYLIDNATSKLYKIIATIIDKANGTS
jgi:hypothetical protein